MIFSSRGDGWAQCHNQMEICIQGAEYWMLDNG